MTKLRAAQRVERRHAGGGDAADRCLGTAGLERIHRLRPPRDAGVGELLLDPGDDVLGGHASGDQYGSPAASASTGTSGVNERSHVAHAAAAGSSDTTRPSDSSALRGLVSST